MSTVSRFVQILAFTLCACLAGCAAHVYESPESVRLQDPLPGEALLYLIRAPHDPLAISVRSAGKNLANLPADTYTAISLAPGTYQLKTVALSLGSSGEAAALDVTLKLEPDARYFLVISGRSERPGQAIQVLDALSKGPFAWYIPTSTSVVPGSREWKPYSEHDARPLLTLAKLVLPER